MQPGGALHPGVSWTRFALAGVVGAVFLAGVAALALLVPESRPWAAAAGALGLGMQWQRRRLQRRRRDDPAPRE